MCHEQRHVTARPDQGECHCGRGGVDRARAPVVPGAAQTTTTCAGIKIPSCSAANSGKVALCDGFETDNPADFSACVAKDCTKYHPSFGTFLKVCGPVATNGTVAV